MFNFCVDRDNRIHTIINHCLCTLECIRLALERKTCKPLSDLRNTLRRTKTVTYYSLYVNLLST